MTDSVVTPGLVSLVGAGPGDPGLITVLGAQRLTESDAVLFDCLANPALLDYARPEAERIAVGRRAALVVMSQQQTSELMIRLARQGKRVVRLKGGDPLVFGRGGEEMEALRAAGIPFEVVPGITAGLAALAKEGIAATHRACASTVTLVAGHEEQDRAESQIVWPSLARLGGTLIFYMGRTQVAHIAEQLISAGMDPATPAAILESVSLPTQRSVHATLATLPSSAEAAAIGTPAVIIVGAVLSAVGEHAPGTQAH